MGTIGCYVSVDLFQVSFCLGGELYPYPLVLLSCTSHGGSPWRENEDSVQTIPVADPAPRLARVDYILSPPGALGYLKFIASLCLMIPGGMPIFMHFSWTVIPHGSFST